jgi:cytidylate kinase
MTTQDNNIVTIDGPAASGKGTVARRVAAALNYAYIDTGAIYRLVAKACLDNGIALENEDDVIKAAQDMASKVTVADFDNPAIRTDDVGNGASKVAAMPKVRAALLQIQKDMAVNPPKLADGEQAKGSVMDGRDIGTVVCPDAKYKFFITANTEIRAQRRTKELQSKGISCTYEAVLQDMRERDARDSGRKTAPMKPADDAQVIDTSSFSVDQVFDQIMQKLASE